MPSKCSPAAIRRAACLAAFGDGRLVAELADHVVEQTPLHRIVIDDENTRGHEPPPNANCAVSRHFARPGLRGR